jgi:multidrug efflux pump subunit AcrA (membrane-fusion protein)
MKPKQIVTGILALLVGGLGVYALLRSHRPAESAPDEAADAPTVVSVQVGSLKHMTMHEYLAGYGTVMPAPATASEPAADAPMAAPTAGVVASVNVVEGQSVSKGDLLMTLNSGAITAAYAAQEVERQKTLYAQQNASLKSLQDAETQLALLTVTAPLAGTVAHVNVKPGAAVDLNTVVVEIMDLNRLVATTRLPESKAAMLKVGEAVQLKTQPPVDAAISYISPTVDASDGTVLARAALPPKCGLRPGQFVPLLIVTGVEADCVAAPEESVVTDVDGKSVIALVNGDHAVQTPVQTGYRENGWVQVIGPGLKAGDAVVTVGAYGLPDKTRIQVAAAARSAPAGPER